MIKLTCSLTRGRRMREAIGRALADVTALSELVREHDAAEVERLAAVQRETERLLAEDGPA
jgi:hypothetical protein